MCFACDNDITKDPKGNHDFQIGVCTFRDVQCPITLAELQQLPGPFAIDDEDVPMPVE